MTRGSALVGSQPRLRIGSSAKSSTVGEKLYNRAGPMCHSGGGLLGRRENISDAGPVSAKSCFFLIKFLSFSPFLGSPAPGLYTQFYSGSEGSQPPSLTQFNRPLPFEIQIPPLVGLSSSKCLDRLLSLRMLKLKIKISD